MFDEYCLWIIFKKNFIVSAINRVNFQIHTIRENHTFTSAKLLISRVHGYGKLSHRASRLGVHRDRASRSARAVFSRGRALTQHLNHRARSVDVYRCYRAIVRGHASNDLRLRYSIVSRALPQRQPTVARTLRRRDARIWDAGQPVVPSTLFDQDGNTGLRNPSPRALVRPTARDIRFRRPPVFWRALRPESVFVGFGPPPSCPPPSPCRRQRTYLWRRESWRAPPSKFQEISLCIMVIGCIVFVIITIATTFLSFTRVPPIRY